VESRTLVADWVVPVSSAPLRDAAVVIEGTRVAWVGPFAELPGRWHGVAVEEISGVLTPGLVNAHAHLQYSAFAALGTERYSSFEEWSEDFEEAYLQVTDGMYWKESADLGARAATASGTTMIGEIVTSPEARGVLAAQGLRGIEYLEVIAQTKERWHGSARSAFVAWLDEPTDIVRGISPHAPYSLDGAVVMDLVALAAERGLRLHSHIAESAIESRLYEYGDRTVLEIFGDLRNEFDLVRTGGAGHSTAEYVETLGLFGPSTHLAHGIYLDRQGRDVMRSHGAAVALCPRSNAVIGVGPAPVAGYLAEGHAIAVGTDSLASTPSLDLMADVAELARIAYDQGYREADLPHRLIRAATLGGAAALGLAGGVIEPGAVADLAAFAVEVDQDDVEGALVEQGEGRCLLTVAQGRTVHDRSALTDLS